MHDDARTRANHAHDGARIYAQAQMREMSRPSVTTHDIAHEAGLSQSTVSRALRGDPRISQATTAHVLAVADRLNYVPNAAARALSTQHAATIAVVIADITNPFYPELVEAIHDEMTPAGYRVVLYNERTDARGDGGLPALVRSTEVDGLIFASATLSAETRDLLRRAERPTVLLNRDVDDIEIDRVLADNARGAELAGDLLADLGHRRIGLIAGPDDTSTTRDREAGFRAALERRGLSIHPDLRRATDYSHRGGYQQGLELLDRPDRPTALFCANDVIAFGALDAARRLHIPVPEQLSIVGFDDIPMSGWEAFSLTTVRQPLISMAREAARILVRRIESKENGATREIFPTHLVQRSTTCPPPSRLAD